MNMNVKDQASSLREMVKQSAAREKRASKIISIASGKGGVGKSSMCVNMGIALSALGYRVLVIDADFGLANVDVMLGVSSKYNMGHLLRGERTIEEIIQVGHGGVRFISGGSGVFELLQMDELQLNNILKDLMRLSDPADIILFDLGAGISDNILRLIASSTETIVITSPEPTAILDAYALVKTVVKDNSQENIRLIMNKCESKKEAQVATDGFIQVIKRHLSFEIKSLGYVLYDKNVVDSIKSQTPVMITHPSSATANNISDIARALMNIPTESRGPGKKIAKLFEWLLN